MHEYSIVQSMLSLCEKYSKGKEVDKIVVKIGKMSGIEPHFLMESFNFFKENTICKDATMQMELIDITIICENCDKKSKVDSYNFFCPYCKSGNTKVLTGQEMLIDYIELKEEK